MKKEEAIYQSKKDLDKQYKLIDGSIINTYSKRKFKELYPRGQGGYQIIGAIGKGMKRQLGTWSHDDKSYPYYAWQYSRLKGDIHSYIPLEEDTYLVIIKSRVMKNTGYIVVILAVIAALSGLLFMAFHRPSGVPIDPNSSTYKVNIEQQAKSEPGTTTIPGYDDIKIQAGTDEAYVALWNPETNSVYFKFKITMKDSGETLYESGLIPPGNAITKLKLSKKITKGVHPIIISITTYALKDYHKQMNGGQVETNLVGIVKQSK